MTPSAWTEERIARLRTLWASNVSASAVARDLGCGITRNAVLSKVHRMGLSQARNGCGQRVAQTGSGSSRSPDGAGRCGAAAGPGRDVPGDDLVPDTPTGSLLTVGRSDCRFPYGDPQDGPLALCGRPVVRGVYCAAHARIAYARVPSSADALMGLAGLA